MESVGRNPVLVSVWKLTALSLSCDSEQRRTVCSKWSAFFSVVVTQKGGMFILSLKQHVFNF